MVDSPSLETPTQQTEGLFVDFDYRKRTKSKFSTCPINESTNLRLRLRAITQSSNMDSYARRDTVHFTKIIFEKKCLHVFFPNLTFYYDDPKC